MFNFGPAELLVVCVVALLFFGPKRLPELAKGLGKGIRDFKKALEGGGSDEKALSEGDRAIDVSGGAKGEKQPAGTEPNSPEPTKA